MQLQDHGIICYSRSMTKDEELEQLRAEKIVLCERLRRKDEELEQSQQANTDLREGLKQAIIAMGSQQERVNVLEGLIDSLQERIKTLEGQQAKDSHNSSLPPSSDRFVRAPKSLRQKSGKKPGGQKKATVGIISSRSRCLIRSSFILSSPASTANTICAPNPQTCQSGVK
jgi:Family of unknown function (DUF6444)